MVLRKAIFIIGLLLLTVSCKNDEASKLNWLEGTWINGENYESWERLSNGNLKGTGYSVENEDTIILETIEIIEKGDQLVFVPDVKNVDQTPPEFKFTVLTDNKFVVQNLKHDFPNYIEYEKISEDSMIACIHGVDSNREKLLFPMKKVK